MQPNCPIPFGLHGFPGDTTEKPRIRALFWRLPTAHPPPIVGQPGSLADRPQPAQEATRATTPLPPPHREDGAPSCPPFGHSAQGRSERPRRADCDDDDQRPSGEVNQAGRGRDDDRDNG